MILKDYIYETLRDDATMHTLLGKSVTPYGIFLVSPPKKPTFPLVTFFTNAQTGRFPRDIPFNFTAWGNTFDAIQSRIFTLLNNQVVTVTDFHSLMLKWDWEGPEIFDQDYKVYVRQSRYLCKAVKL